MSENRKRILDTFQQHLYQNYEKFCKRQDLQPTAQGLIIFLIDHDLIPPVTIKRYTVLQEFEEVFPKQEHHKTQTVHILSDRFNIPERTVWGILKKKT